MQERLKIKVQGQVQGVGFRPFVYLNATQHQLTGWVKNTSEGVVMEIQGVNPQLIIEALENNPPKLASIDSIKSHPISLIKHEKDFKIIASEIGKVTTKITPDVATCEQCLQELFDPNSRYYHYPFLNCTHCGPRFTITKNLPYDRNETSMVEFPLCDDCKQDYENPLNRRYHAQPTACHQCGPQLSHSVASIVDKINNGEIVAVKGLGGYQLIVDAHNPEAIQRLRDRKHRGAKPFALMALNINSVKQWAVIDEKAEKLLMQWQRPIVLLPKCKSGLAEAIAPGLDHLGFMLAYTPLHYLLFNELAHHKNGLAWLHEKQESLFIVTSANPGDVPLITKDETAKNDLAGIADTVVSYNREIVTRADDSVLKIMKENAIFIRRARSYVPNPIKLSKKLPPILAVGAHLKNTFCIIREDEAFVSQHIGDINNKETREYFLESVQHLSKLLQVKPEFAVHDLHPDFFTTNYAQSLGIKTIAVQHHHAHLAAVAAEHHLPEPALGLALDGYGLGTDGTAWGGELLLLQGQHFERLGYFKPMAMPGGDKAAKEPWRMALSLLYEMDLANEIDVRFSAFNKDIILQMLQKNINSPRTSSCGRLFDAASSL